MNDAPLSGSDFLYAKGSDGKWYALYKGKITEHRLDIFTGSYFDNVKCERIIWGVASSPPTYPTAVPYNPVETTVYYSLTFENMISEEWLSRDFRLKIHGKEFLIEGWSVTPDGIHSVYCETIPRAVL